MLELRRSINNISGDKCLYSINKYCHDTGRPFKGAWLKDRESIANFFSARIYMKVIDNH